MQSTYVMDQFSSSWKKVNVIRLERLPAIHHSDEYQKVFDKGVHCTDEEHAHKNDDSFDSGKRTAANEGITPRKKRKLEESA